MKYKVGDIVYALDLKNTYKIEKIQPSYVILDIPLGDIRWVSNYGIYNNEELHLLIPEKVYKSKLFKALK